MAQGRLVPHVTPVAGFGLPAVKEVGRQAPLTVLFPVWRN
jgi:hypothetical protein